MLDSLKAWDILPNAGSFRPIQANSILGQFRPSRGILGPMQEHSPILEQVMF